MFEVEMKMKMRLSHGSVCHRSESRTSAGAPSLSPGAEVSLHEIVQTRPEFAARPGEIVSARPLVTSTMEAPYGLSTK